MSYFRIQSYDPQALLAPENWISLPYSGVEEDVRSGVSVCRSLEDLVKYFAGSGVPLGDLLVEVDGYASDDTALDADQGEMLIFPTKIISVTPIDDSDFFTMMDDYLGDDF